MNVLDWLKKEFDAAETFAQVKLAPWLETLLGKIEQDVVTMAMPYVATAAAELGVEIVSGKPVEQILTDMHATAQAAVQKLAQVGVSVAAKDLQTAVNSFFVAQQNKPVTAAIAP